MKGICLLCCLVFMNVLAFSQAHEGTVAYQKKMEPAAVIVLPYKADMVQASLDDYLSKKGKSKLDDRKGFITYRNTGPVSDSIYADLYFRVERKSRQEKDATIVSLLLTAPAAHTAANTSYLDMQGAKAYLDELVPAIEAYSLELQIKEQNELVIKAESKFKDLEEDGNDLQKKIADLEKKMEHVRADIQKQQHEIEAQKARLSQLVSQRKT